MILTGSEIKRNVSLGRIVIAPFNSKQVNPNSYNYRLGKSYIELDEQAVIDLRSRNTSRNEIELESDGTTFYPGHVYLCNTYEVIGSQYYVTSLIGKSSMGRLGMFIQLSADLGHQGEIHRWTLEIRPTIPIIVYPHMIIGQVTFWKVYGQKKKSLGYYKNFDLPTLSRGIEYDIDRQ
ncbi:Deoxycytidine triphosphate deaminase [Clostridium sp. C105KSO15]|nr:Deoxycytidine triphosphate deaminase [Clostridium sp. C105KSO15]